MIVLTGAIGGAFAYKWAFDEAIEIQDAALIQIVSLAQMAGSWAASLFLASRRTPGSG